MVEEKKQTGNGQTDDAAAVEAEGEEAEVEANGREQEQADEAQAQEVPDEITGLLQENERLKMEVRRAVTKRYGQLRNWIISENGPPAT